MFLLLLRRKVNFSTSLCALVMIFSLKIVKNLFYVA
jgi:hypothetical protein